MACAPPPPPPPLQQISSFDKSGSKNDRGLLLESIRKGKTLKKTVTNDKSGPFISGNIPEKSSVSSSSSNANIRTVSNNRQSNEVQSGGLGGLFVNGIPKLKATGLPIGQAYQQYRNQTDSIKSKPNNVHISNNVSNNIHNTSFNTKNRGPPPQPPGAPLKIISSSPDKDVNEISSHSRTASAVSLNDSYQNRVSDVTQVNHGKPSVAPKPHNFGIKLDRPLVSRAQSMRIPKSSHNTTKTENGSQNAEFNQSELYRISNKNPFPSFHQSQESLNRRNNRSSSPSRMASANSTSWASLNNSSATLRPYNRSHGSPLRPPLSKPPPPPPTRIAMSPPMCPPPPPPTHAPPPPPHRVNPAPPPPSALQNRLNNNNNNNHNNNLSCAPPMPPVRNSSMRNSTTTTLKTSSFESRFISMFHSIEEFPQPQPYENVIKIYNSRIQAKQQAPQPPLQLQQSINRMWQCENLPRC